ncbi:MAG: putative Ig domain-containing protein [Bacteroidota bacterium]
MKKELRLSFIFLSLVILPFSLYSQAIPEDSLYLGQTPPGNTAVLFAPGIISTAGRFEHAAIFSRDGKEFYFAESSSDWSRRIIYVRKYKNNSWTVEEKASFSINQPATEPTISYSNDTLIFTDGDDLWLVTRNDINWTEPRKLPSVIDTFDVQWHPTIALNGDIFFSSRGRIYKSAKENNDYQIPVKLPVPINTFDLNGDAVIAPDEGYIIFGSNRAGGYGNNDLYISYLTKDNNWTNPINLGPKINSEKFDDASSISPDGKYFFFSRRTNRECDIYWVRIDNVIDSLKHTNFVPYVKNPIPDQTATKDSSFNYQIPDSTFIDDDGNNTLTYSATLSDGNPLPAWLSFDPATRMFSGTPTTTSAYTIKVTATDTANASVSCTFGIGKTKIHPYYIYSSIVVIILLLLSFVFKKRISKKVN